MKEFFIEYGGTIVSIITMIVMIIIVCFLDGFAIRRRGTGMHKKLMKNQKGAACVEILLIMVIVIAVTLIFKEQLLNLVVHIFELILGFDLGL